MTLYSSTQRRQEPKNHTIFYEVIAKTLINTHKQPIILVDWSHLSPCGNYQFLSASIPLKGRSLPILEIAYSIEHVAKLKTHNVFLEILKSIVPTTCKPIIVTDAGFKNPWFKKVQSLGWDFLGRTASNIQYLKNETWERIDKLYQGAHKKAEFLYSTELAKKNPMYCHIYRYKEIHKGRISKTLVGTKRKNAQNKAYAKRAKTPWVLVSSLAPDKHKASEIIKTYKKRMQIEESFRDLKDGYHGLGLNYCGTRNADKLSVALLIGSIARLLLWLMGLAIKKQRLHRSYQANTVKKENVLSNFYLSKQYILNFKQGESPPLSICFKFDGIFQEEMTL